MIDSEHRLNYMHRKLPFGKPWKMNSAKDLVLIKATVTALSW